EKLSWKTMLFDAGVSFATAGLLDPKVLKTVGGAIQTRIGNMTKWISESVKDIPQNFSKYIAGRSENGSTLARIYVEIEQKGLAGIAKEFEEALKKDLRHIGSNVREQLEKLGNSLSLPPKHQYANIP
ncbi:hypothetical protein ACFCP7_29005, partial [Paenibacillus elgii]